MFNFFCGCLYNDPIVLAIDNADQLNAPPIILYPIGDPPANVTYDVTTASLSDGEPLVVYQFWYFWPGCALAPTSPLCRAGHTANDWEPIYIYWKTTNPLAPQLLAVYSRIHFAWQRTAGSSVPLNGTQIIVTFSSTYHTPTIDTSSLTAFFKPPNASLSIPVSQSTLGLTSWSYPLINGASHLVNVWMDPNSPPASGPYAYENTINGNGGPADPLTVYGITTNLQLGVLGGFASAFALFLFLTAVRIDIRGFRRALKRR